jgi:hypothetical protein
MHATRQQEILLDAATRLAAWSFERLQQLAEEQWVEEVGTPDNSAAGQYCQVEAELLDRFTEGGVEVLHIPVTAGDGYRQFGTDLFVYKSGRVRWDRKIYELIDGVPKSVE